MTQQYPEHEARIGRVYFNRYRFEEFIRPGMALVYRAFDLQTNLQVAVKILTDVNNRDLNARFQREILIYSQFHHHNIVRYHDANMMGVPFGENGPEVKYLVTVWEGDKTVNNLIEDAYLFTTPELLQICLHIIKQLAEPLNLLHGGIRVQDQHHKRMTKHIVHRDIKPSNIVFRMPRTSTDYLNASVVLIDFGIAKEYYEIMLERPTHTPSDDGLDRTRNEAFDQSGGGENRHVGTYNFMSTEQWIDSPLLNAATDEYALSLTLYAILSGNRSPFGTIDISHVSRTDTESAVRAWWHTAHMIRPRVDPLLNFRPDIPEAVWHVIERGFNLKQANRYLTISEFVHAFEEAITPPPPPPEPIREEPPSPILSSIFLAILSAIFTLIPSIGKIKSIPPKPVASLRPPFKFLLPVGAAVLVLGLGGMGLFSPLFRPVATPTSTQIAFVPSETATPVTTQTETPVVPTLTFTVLPVTESPIPVPTTAVPTTVVPTITPSPTPTDTPRPTETETPTITPSATVPPSETPLPTTTPTATDMATVTPVTPSLTPTAAPRALKTLITEMLRAIEPRQINCAQYISAYEEFRTVIRNRDAALVDGTNLVIKQDGFNTPTTALASLYSGCDTLQTRESQAVSLDTRYDNYITLAKGLLTSAANTLP